MKKIILLLFIAVVLTEGLKAQVAINSTGDDPNPNAMLDVSSHDKGMLIPRMSTAERTGMNLGAAENGLYVYDTDTNSFWYWDGTQWKAMGSGAVSEDKDWYKEGTTTAPTDITDNMFHMGNVAIGKNTATDKLDVFDDQASNVLKVENASTAEAKRTAGIFNIDGAGSIGMNGKMGIVSTIGGHGASDGFAPLVGAYHMVIGDDTNTQYQYGTVNEIGGTNSAFKIGTNNYLYGNVPENTYHYGTLNMFYGTGDGTIFGTYEYFVDNGDGLRFGTYRRMGGSGNGNQFGAFNRIVNSGTGKHIGTINEIKNRGPAAHIGTLNAIGAGVPEEDTDHIVPITNDSDGKRIGEINVVAGNGGGIHVAEANNIISTGNGLHAGEVTVLGHDYTTNDNTSTTGLHVGSVINLTDTGNQDRFGSVNLMGLIMNPADPMNPVHVTGDADARRVAEVNSIGGDGNGMHIAESNNVISTGNGYHAGQINMLGHNYVNNTNTSTTGIHTGTVNNLTDTGNRVRIGETNVIGLILNPADYTNPIPVTGDSDAKRIGEINTVGGDGNGQHYGVINSIVSTGNGLHVASFNKVGPGGTGPHIAVYGEVDDNDPTAMAGVFKGDVTARNYISIINIAAGVWLENNETNWADLPKYNVAFSPQDYSKTGMVEIKIVAKISGFNGTQSDHQFRVRALQNGAASTIIAPTDTWTWTQLKSDTYMISTDWKPWNAGIAPWLLSFQVKNSNGASLKFTNIYVMVRPVQISAP